MIWKRDDNNNRKKIVCGEKIELTTIVVNWVLTIFTLWLIRIDFRRWLPWNWFLVCITRNAIVTYNILLYSMHTIYCMFTVLTIEYLKKISELRQAKTEYLFTPFQKLTTKKIEINFQHFWKSFKFFQNWRPFCWTPLKKPKQIKEFFSRFQIHF